MVCPEAIQQYPLTPVKIEIGKCRPPYLTASHPATAFFVNGSLHNGLLYFKDERRCCVVANNDDIQPVLSDFMSWSWWFNV